MREERINITKEAVDRIAPSRPGEKRFSWDRRLLGFGVYECILRTLKRKEEVAAMRWEEIDQATWLWTIPAERMKTREAHVMDLPRQVVAILERLHPNPKKRRGFVFSFDGSKSIKVSTQDKANIDAHVMRRVDLADLQATATDIDVVCRSSTDVHDAQAQRRAVIRQPRARDDQGCALQPQPTRLDEVCAGAGERGQKGDEDGDVR